MKVIQQSDALFYEIVGCQPSFKGNARKMKYVIQQEAAGGILVFNALTCELVFCDNAEISEIENYPFFREHWFVVPENFNEKQLFDQVKPIIKYLNSDTESTLYTILTTTDCNARCFYCFENGVQRVPMSSETAHKVSDYIIRKYQDSESRNIGCSQFREVQNINWYGGEPLYNASVIDIITKDLAQAGVPYTSAMVTNGYLFTSEIIQKAKNLWNLKNVQITLDGTEEVYNRVKSYYRIKDNAYQRVMDNIQMLLDAEIIVDIRLNMDLHNADNLLLLADELKERFQGSGNLFCYSRTLFENLCHKSTREDLPQLNVKRQQLRRKLSELGLVKTIILPQRIGQKYCHASNPRAVVITPTGNMCKCPLAIDRDYFSNIDNPDVWDEAMLEKWTITVDEPECADCAYYPLCGNLKLCPYRSSCTETRREWMIEKIKAAMLKIYSQQVASPHTHSPFTSEPSPRTSNPSSLKYKVFPLLGDYIAVGIPHNRHNGCYVLHRMNEVGKDIFQLFISGKSIEKAVEALLKEYDATEEELTAVVREFYDNLL